MSKYLIAWTEEEWYNVVIEADSKNAALDIFYNQEYDREDVKHVGSELQDSVEVEQL